MPSEKSRYVPAPPIPTYDEATAGDASSSRTPWASSSDPEHTDTRPDHETEAQSLLSHNRSGSRSLDPSRRAPGGYRPPQVETDDEGSEWSLEDDSDGDEASQVRREMQELEIEDPLNDDNSSTRSWTKRIGLSRFALPRWKWRWRLPRLTVRLPRQADSGTNANDDDADPSQASGTRTRWRFPTRLPTINLTTRDLVLIIGRLLALTIVVGTVWLLFVSDLFGSMSRRLNGQQFDPEAVRTFVYTNVYREQIGESLRHYTSFAHIAGTEGDYALAMDVHNSFLKYNFDNVAVDEYYTYLNYPKEDGRAIEVLSKDKKQVVWSADLEEIDTGVESAGHQTYSFHGHSKTGTIQGPLIYANYGSRKDFARLAEKGIDTKGAIALVRYHGTQPSLALKVKAAELAGFAGCIVYTDPADNGFSKGHPAPKGRTMPADGVQRGSVSLSNWVIGDPLTPFRPSKEDNPRISVDEAKALVNIPSLPIAWRDAKVLLQHIEGFGEACPKNWRGGVPNVRWWTGNSSSPIVRLQNEQDVTEKQTVWNIYGKIEGYEQAEKDIIIGNHRDSWAFGASEPNSGTAIMLEVARVFSDLVARGWRPLRSIVFMSWDAQTYNAIGSTEFVEKNLDDLQRDAYAYINLDAAISGRDFHAAGSPVFRKLVTRILERVFDPVANTTLSELWKERRADLEEPALVGSGAGSDNVNSDVTPFQYIAGTSSLDIRFGGEMHPAHSSYDNFAWMESIGDPEFVYHGLLGQVLGMLILELADRPILPFDMGYYAHSLGEHVKRLGLWSGEKIQRLKAGNKGGDDDEKKWKLDLEPIKAALSHVEAAVAQFEKWEPWWEAEVVAANGWEPAVLGVRRLEYNSRMADFETGLLDLEMGGGIPNRTQFRHVVYGPQLWNEYSVEQAHFPAIMDAIEAGDLELAQDMVLRAAKAVDRAAGLLVPAADEQA
ncbi:Zn-dependent exopeptidase [Astrocystis sublimbata]|nr:Zn-dependent exopeptidase [Astrocystis sublimbata]